MLEDDSKQYRGSQIVITTIATVSAFIEDQDRAKAFYTEKLGFELINDSEMFPGSGMRWLTVAPLGCPTALKRLPIGGPQVQDWGSFAILVDSEGNQIVLGQRG